MRIELAVTGDISGMLSNTDECTYCIEKIYKEECKYDNSEVYYILSQ